MKKEVVLLLGAPGSGKGTQAVGVSKQLGIPHISTGDLFRYHIKNQTSLGVQVKDYLDQGKLVPDDIVLGMLFERISQKDCEKGFLLDGFPRTVHQAEALDKRLATFDHKLIVVNLRVDDAVVVERITGRRTCSQCGRIYHVKSSPPRTDGVCDACHASLIQRPDDSAQVVKERLKAYHKQTKPLEDYYRAKGLLQEVDGTKPPEEVFQAILAIIK